MKARMLLVLLTIALLILALPHSASAVFLYANASALRLDAETVRISVATGIDWSGDDLYAFFGLPRTGPNGQPAGFYPRDDIGSITGAFGLPIGGSYRDAEENRVYSANCYFDVRTEGLLFLRVYRSIDFIYEYQITPHGGVPYRIIAGSLEGSFHSFAELPTGIGQSVTFTQMPEPPAVWLLGLGLLPVLKFRRRHRSPLN